MLEKYRAHVVPNPDVELIHASSDDTAQDALKWALKFGFPWPTVLLDDWEAVGLQDYGISAGEVILVDSSGKIVAEGKKKAFAKIMTQK